MSLFYGRVETLDSCDCFCHRSLPGTVMHVMACCTTCDYCNRNVKIFSANNHQEQCSMNPKNMKQPIDVNLKENNNDDSTNSN